MEQTCNRCGLTKPRDQFAADPRKVSGLQGRCRECQREVARARYKETGRLPTSGKPRRPAIVVPAGEAPQRTRKRYWLWDNYRITIEQYDELYADQEGRCAICPTPISDNFGRPGRATVFVDHCHRDGRVRALLCHHCNSGLGMFRDDPDLIEAAAAYLRRYSSR